MNCEIPEWYIYQCLESPIIFVLPFVYPGSRLKVFSICVKFQVDCATVNGHGWFGLEFKVSINDFPVWSSEAVPLVEGSRRITVEVLPYEYIWLIVLHPYKDFSPNWNEILEVHMEQTVSSMKMDCNDEDYDWDLLCGSIWIRFTVSFEVNHKSKNNIIINIKRCGLQAYTK